MLRQGDGSVILMASANTAMATPQAIAYGASMAAIAHLTRSIAMLATRSSAYVRCNSVHPGSIEAEMSERLIAAIASNADLTVAQIEERFRSAISMGVRAILAMCPRSSYTWHPTRAATRPRRLNDRLGLVDQGCWLPATGGIGIPAALFSLGFLMTPKSRQISRELRGRAGAGIASRHLYYRQV